MPVKKRYDCPLRGELFTADSAKECPSYRTGEVCGYFGEGNLCTVLVEAETEAKEEEIKLKRK